MDAQREDQQLAYQHDRATQRDSGNDLSGSNFFVGFFCSLAPLRCGLGVGCFEGLQCYPRTTIPARPGLLRAWFGKVLFDFVFLRRLNALTNGV